MLLRATNEPTLTYLHQGRQKIPTELIMLLRNQAVSA